MEWDGGVTWRVAVDPVFADRTWDTGETGLKSTGSGFYSEFTEEMRQLWSVYTRQRRVDTRTAYLFWFAQRAEDDVALQGDMPLKSQFGFIFSRDIDNVYRTMAHELAHGSFQLRHTFGDRYKIPIRTTDNLMDYDNGTVLKKYQWDLIHDPKTMPFVWAQGEEEGAMMAASDECWEKGRAKWDKVTPQKYQDKKKLVYDRECGYFYSGNLRRSYFGLTNGNILIVDQKRSTRFSDEVVNVYHLYISELNEWFEVDINTFEDNCLSCDLNFIAAEVTKLVGKTVGRYILPIEDVYILLEGKDFDGNQANRAVATGFILIEFIPGGKILKPVTKGLKAGTKATVKGSRKIYTFVRGSKVVVGEFADDVLKPARWIVGEVDEVVEVLQDVTYTTVDGKEVKGALQVVKKGDEVGFRLAKFTTKEVDEFAQAATKNPDSKKVILGKYIENSPLSYNEIAKKGNYTYFNLKNWNEVYDMVGKNRDEMWRINKKFLDDQIENGKDIFFSHDPWKADGYFEKEVLHLIDKGAKDFVEVGNGLWKAIW